MPGYSPNPTQETVRYKNIKSANEENQHAKILISSSFGENQDSDQNQNRPQSKFCFYSTSVLITLFITLFVILINFYYHTNILQSPLEGSCVPLQQVEKVIISSESSDFESCSDNKTCHRFLNVIEQKHDGLKNNFVIGQRGELYIGGGFKCAVKGDENVLYVKLLRTEKLESIDKYLEMCFRLSEILNHGVLCGKISPEYAIQDGKEICSILESGKNKSYHVHDPEYEMKLVHRDFGWTTCGPFSTTANVEKDKVITLESLPKNSCSPLQLVEKITIDIEESPSSPQPICFYHLSCIQKFERYYDSLKYNFIIRYNEDTYVGLGFKCKADNPSNILRIKVLQKPGSLYFTIGNFFQIEKYLQIIKEGFHCGKISKRFSVEVNCFIVSKPNQIGVCRKYYENYNYNNLIKLKFEKDFPDFNTVNSTIGSEDSKHIVPRGSMFQFCHKERSQDTTTLMSEPTANIDTTNIFLSEPTESIDTITTLVSEPTASIDATTDHAIVTSDYSCIPFKQVDKVILITERTGYLCPKNVTCESFLDFIEQNHDGFKYNFVIGPRGELYIGAGFKCLVNSEEDALYVKFLKTNLLSEEEQHLAVCSRLSEIIRDGVLCEKISQHYSTVVESRKKTESWVPYVHNLCLDPEDELYKNRSHHLHDPDYKMRILIPENFKWTFCEDSSNRMDMENDRVITLESLPKKSCSPLQLVDEITVDVVETSPFDCSDDASCLQSFEEHHDGLNYNFIIGHHHDVYVGLGFDCKAGNISDNILKIKVLNPPEQEYTDFTDLDEHWKVIQIIHEGLICGRISEMYSVKANCNIANYKQRSVCAQHYSHFEHTTVSMYANSDDYNSKKYFSVSGRGVVPRTFKYQLCQGEHQPDPSIFESEYDLDPLEYTDAYVELY